MTPPLDNKGPRHVEPLPERRPLALADQLRVAFKRGVIVLGAVGVVLLVVVAWQLFRTPTQEDGAASAGMEDPSSAQAGIALAWFFYGFVLLALGFIALVAALGVRWHTARRRARKLGWNCCPCCQYELVVEPEDASHGTSSLVSCPECGMRNTREQIRKHWMAGEPV